MQYFTDSFECQRCGVFWNRAPALVRCADCGQQLCPQCGPIRCECGEPFCGGCVVRLEDGAGGLYLCRECHAEASACEGCGAALADFLLEDSDPHAGYHGHLALCASCCLKREAVVGS